MKAEIIRELKMTCADLATKKIERSSVLLQKKGIKNMVKQEDVINEIFQEVKDRFVNLLYNKYNKFKYEILLMVTIVSLEPKYSRCLPLMQEAYL